MNPRPLTAHDSRQFPVLYVDDEPENLRIFELTFRRDFTILTAQSAEEGMRVLNDNPVAVVLSDHKMPGMTGVEFLSRAREIDEHAVRILVTAYGDAEILGSAINDGRIYRYIPKPWKPDEMALTLRRAIERYALDRERNTLVDELTLLNRLSRTLHRELDPDRVVRLLIDAAHNELGFGGAAVLLFTPDRQALRWASIAPRDDVAERVQQLELTRAGAPQFFDALDGGARQSFGIDHLADAEGPVREWLAEVSADELAVVPLAAQTGVIGAIAIDNRTGGRRFGADDRTLLDGLSTQAVIALENARTVAALRSSRSQLQRADRLGTLGRLSLDAASGLDAPLAAAQEFVRNAPERRRSGDEGFWKAEHADVSSALDRAREQLATLARIDEAQEPTGRTAAVDLGELARDVVLLLAREATAANVTVVLDADPTTPKVVGERSLLHQLLLTLGMNAIRWTPPQGRVSLQVRPDPDEPDELALVEVVDSGPGMEPAELDRVFEPARPDDDAQRGFGLMIAHQIAREHAGAISVRSTPGNGSTFSVRLPADGSAAIAPPPARPTA